MTLDHTARRRWAVSMSAAVAIAIALALDPATASAAPAPPATADQAAQQVARTGQELTQLDEEVHQARLGVAALQEDTVQAQAAATAAQETLDGFQPALRAFAQSSYTAGATSRAAAILTSESAEQLVQQMTTLDMIASYTDQVLGDVAAAQQAALAARAQADAAAGDALAALTALEQQQADVQARVAAYEADFARLSATEQAVVTTTLAGPTLTAPSSQTVGAQAPSEAAEAIVRAALAELGDPYVWGGNGPDGFDCSGLTQAAYAAAGISLPHSSRSQSQMGVAVSRAELQPGDLVYFYEPVSHIGLYIGDGKMVHARTFGQPVSVTTVDMAGYAGARRIL